MFPITMGTKNTKIKQLKTMDLPQDADLYG